MANVFVSTNGGRSERASGVSTVQDAYNHLDLEGNYDIGVNGQPATMDTELSERDDVDFTLPVKGGVL